MIMVVRRKPFRHWLNALAIPGPDQPRTVKRTHPPPCLVTQALQKRLKPASKLGFPIQCGFRHGRPLDRKSTRLNSSHSQISYAVFCLKKKKKQEIHISLHGLTSTAHETHT